MASWANGFSLECLPLLLNNFDTIILSGKINIPPKKNIIMLVCILTINADIPVMSQIIPEITTPELPPIYD
jgi:hypothetical protein